MSDSTPQNLVEAVRYWEPIFEIGTGDEVLGYLAEGRVDAAVEVVSSNADLHYLCSNFSKGEGLSGLAVMIRRDARRAS